MKLSGNFGVSGILAKEDERYQVIDNNTSVSYTHLTLPTIYSV